MPDPYRHSVLTGELIRSILYRCGVSRGKFMRDAGLADLTARKILDGRSDGDVPKWVDAILLLYLIDDEVRTSDKPWLLNMDMAEELAADIEMPNDE